MEKTVKTTVFNLIILDESGSMSPLTQQTVDGCNETLNVIRSLNKKYGDTQRNLVSIYLFQDNAEIPSRYVYKNKPVADVPNMTTEIYRPWGGTPLLDAVGSTLVDLRAIASTHEDSTAIVTIITDGMENASHHYTYEQVAHLISELKEKGWTFNFIGANIDVNAISKRLHIDNNICFRATAGGTQAMWTNFKDSLSKHEERRIQEEASCYNLSKEERRQLRKKNSKGFFDL